MNVFFTMPYPRIGLSSAFHFHAAFYYKKSTANVIKAMSLRKSPQAETEGVLSLQYETWENTWVFQGRNREQAEEQVGVSSILDFQMIPAPTIAHFSFTFWSLAPSASPLSLCQISFFPMETTSRKFQDHLQECTVSITSYLELSYKKYYLAFVIKSLSDYSNICRKKPCNCY